MIYPRDLAITLDHAAGASMQELAGRYNMHASRIGQIVTATRRRVSGTMAGKEELGLLLARQYGPSKDLANTPEQFYFYERGLSRKEEW